jgi:hypothetical protein
MVSRTATALLVAFTLACLLALALLGEEAPKVRDVAPSGLVCYEDDPCWDCRTMGNRVCGPEGR